MGGVNTKISLIKNKDTEIFKLKFMEVLNSPYYFRKV